MNALDLIGSQVEPLPRYLSLDKTDLVEAGRAVRRNDDRVDRGNILRELHRHLLGLKRRKIDRSRFGPEAEVPRQQHMTARGEVLYRKLAFLVGKRDNIGSDDLHAAACKRRRALEDDTSGYDRVAGFRSGIRARK